VADDIMNRIEAAADEPVSDEQLSQVAQLGALLETEYATLEQIEAALEAARARINDIELNALPAAMEQIGLRSFTLESGAAMEIQPFYSLKSSDKTLAWLVTHGHADLIKSNITVAFTKGQAKDVAKARKLLDKAGFSYEVKEAVHPSTGKAWLREQVEAGNAPPLDELDAYIGRKATMRKPKARR